MKKCLYDILEEISELPSNKEKAQALSTNRFAEALKIIFKYTFDPDVKWLLPEGDPPYKPCEFLDVEGRFLQELRKLYLFLDGGNPNLSNLRRETLFIQMLESIDPKDAKLLLAMKDKKNIFSNSINKTVVKQAFPDIGV